MHLENLGQIPCGRPTFPNLVPRLFSVLKEQRDKVGRFPYSLKLTNICTKESF